MFNESKRVTLTVCILLGLIILFASIYFFQHKSHENEIDLSEFHGTLLKNPREMAPFSFTATDNKPFDTTWLQGKWTLVFFGFTQCGYLCPTTLAQLSNMHHLLITDGTVPLPAVVMISLDPERDTLSGLKAYVQGFNSNFYAARGDEESVKRMANELGIAYDKVQIDGDNNPHHYDIQHSGALMLFNPKGQLNAFFTTPLQAAWLAKDYNLLVSKNKIGG